MGQRFVLQTTLVVDETAEACIVIMHDSTRALGFGEEKVATWQRALGACEEKGAK